MPVVFAGNDNSDIGIIEVVMKRIITLLLVITTLLSCLFSFSSCSNDKNINEPGSSVIDHAYNEGGCVPGQIVDSGVALVTRKLSASEYETYDVSESAESAYVVNATVKPEDALDKRLIWTISWSDESGWASGKDITDYVSLEGSDDNAAVITCYQAFGTQISVNACLAVDSTKSAVLTLDYAARVAGYRIDFGDWTYKNMNFEDDDVVTSPVLLDVGSNSECSGVLNVTPFLSSVYTVKDNFSVKAICVLAGDHHFTYKGLSMSFYGGFFSIADVDVYGKMISFGLDEINTWWFWEPDDRYKVYFSSFEPENLFEFLSEMNGQTLFSLKLQFEGTYSSFECEVPIVCGGVKNSAA